MKPIICSIVLLAASALNIGCASEAKPKPAPLTGLSKSDPVYVYVESVRGDLLRGKVDIINSVMHLNAEESKVFWPIYQDYETELFELGDKRLELIRRYSLDLQRNTLDDKKATELADGYFQFQSASLDLVKKYHGIIAKDLSPRRAAQFTQIEHRVGTVIDLMIASDLPLVVGSAGK